MRQIHAALAGAGLVILCLFPADPLDPLALAVLAIVLINCWLAARPTP